MANNIRKYLEYSFFIVLNIGLLLPIYSILLLFVPHISNQIVTSIYKIPFYLVVSLDDPTIIFVYIILICLIFSFKPLIFIIIYLFKNLFPNIHIIFETLRKNSKYLILVLVFSFILDIISYFFFQNIVISYFGDFINFLLFFLLFGLLSNYITFLLFFPPNIMNNVKSKSIIFIINFMLILIRFIIIFILILLSFLLVVPVIIPFVI